MKPEALQDGKKSLHMVNPECLLKGGKERSFIRLLFDEKMFRFDPDARIHTENIGPENHYIDPCAPLERGRFQVFRRACQYAAKAIEARRLDQDAVIGVPNKGTMVALEIARLLDVPCYSYPEVAASNWHVGDEKYLVIDDVSASGQSLAKQIKRMKESGARVVGAFTFYDKQLGAAGILAGLNVPLYCLTTFENLLTFGREDGYLTDEQVEKIRTWHEGVAKRLADQQGTADLSQDAAIVGISGKAILEWRSHLQEATRLLGDDS